MHNFELKEITVHFCKSNNQKKSKHRLLLYVYYMLTLSAISIYAVNVFLSYVLMLRLYFTKDVNVNGDILVYLQFIL